MMEDLTGYTMDELALRVMNEEPLYVLRDNVTALTDAIDAQFTYTGSQLEIMHDTIDADKEER